jgi:hypothetical protein
VVGDNMPDDMIQKIERHLSYNKIFKFPVAWMDTGHVDEVLLLLPNKQKHPGECSYVLGISSPQLLREVLRKHNFHNEKDRLVRKPLSSLGDSEVYQVNSIRECLTLSDKKIQATEVCTKLWEANDTYEQMIATAASEIASYVANVSKCDLKIVKIPQLFFPAHLDGGFGTAIDEAKTYHPNLANSTVIQEHVIFAEQAYAPIQQHFISMLESLGLKAHAVNANVLHHMGGGLHCATQTLRVCEEE